MLKRFMILSATVSALCAGALLPPLLNWTHANDVWRGAALVASVTGVAPFNVVRLLGLLMAVHYLLELPVLMHRARFHWAKAKGIVAQLFCGSQIATSISIRVTVPVMFYAVFGGGHDLSNIYGLANYIISA